MKKGLILALALVCVAALFVGYSHRDIVVGGDYKPQLMVEGTIYSTTGKEMPGEIDPSAIIGEITSSVPQHELPTEDGQSNFGAVGAPYAYCEVGDEEGLAVLLNDEWSLYQAESD